MKKSGTSLMLLLAVVGVLTTMTSCANEGAEDNGRAKYVFLMIGDGMGENHVTATEFYMSWKAGNLGAEKLVCTQFPVLGFSSTYSGDNNITDSAAGGTTIATGQKTYNGAIGLDLDKEPLRSVAYTLHADGYKVGITTSVPVNHATPAAFYAHQESRGMYYEIGLELPQSTFEFFAGSGLLDNEGANNDLDPLDQLYENDGYKVYYGVKELQGTKDRSEEGAVLLQPSSKQAVSNYEINEETQDDRLGEVLSAAISYLGDESPFFIMCEGGEIDWGAHDNNIMDVIDAVTRFDEAINVAYNFYLEHPEETLIVITADHETGGLALGSGEGYMIDWEGLEQAYSDHSKKHDNKENREISISHNIGWTTYGHPATPVPVYAIGKGAEKFGGRIDNTEIYGKIVGE